MQFFLKVLISALVIAGASELAKQHRLLAAAIISLPLTSLLAIVWIHLESGDRQLITTMSQDIFWLVTASLIFFIVFPILLRYGLHFWLSMAIACGLTSAGYGVYMLLR